ncbi:hypothetical protein MYCTH_2306800 [Thermothelomyces thermophilus ATCC 42464]|uniref:Uncharacterized protein n=1 Tax=Thermothelomyces thermophilus (strain ATCC 42464 / BCRC 31852 / DSM 1799) TaxID=573729 RepID=G2QEU5_THET4|nr:uncharacterized protein MYCTH_2306800 [Thermothelomyces thermophilus ATCC 42464]AEO58974.1 hypothetical protein MYCTH_2306800 [Thermothelomyces thermophilus ATCC 42464]
MAVEGATQALIAAFFFGIVLNAASAALVLFVKGYGLSAVFRDSQRLVLVLFLLSAALWAQTDFITILLDITASNVPCQVGIIFATVFDQLARFSVEQFLLWALNLDNGAKLSLMQLIPQVLVLARFLAGAVFIGFIRPQTDDFCVATTSALPVGILVTALDGAIISLLIIRAYSAGGAAKDDQYGKGVTADRARALMAVLLGLVFWTGTSVPMLLGLATLALATRTALPAGGLLIVIIFVAGGADTLLASRKASSHPPEAPSPRRINISRDVSTSDTDYPPTRFEDLKEAALRSSRTFVNPREAPKVKDETGIMFATEAERIRAMPKTGLVDFGKGKIAISHPILLQNGDQNPATRIALMGLEEAAAAEKERRARALQDESARVGVRAAARSNGMAPEEALKRGISLKRKEVASASIRETLFPGTLPPGEGGAVARTTSAQPSPGGEETRRRSPRPSLQEESAHARPAFPAKAEEALETNPQSRLSRPLTSQQPLLRPNIRPSRTLPPSPPTPPPEPTKTPLQRRPTIGLPSNPRAQGVKVAEEPGSQHRTILFLNNIQYNDPSTVEAIIKTAGNPSSKPSFPAAKPPSPQSVVNRPRPIPRKPADSPAEFSPAFGHRRTRSSGSLMGRKSRLASSPGSPTALPPLPPLPVRSATVASRPHPNNTKSMTVEEKVTLFFPNPPSATASKRRSSVPEVPRVPAFYLGTGTSPTKQQHGQRASNQTTKTSTGSESVSDVEEIQRRSGKTLLKNAGEAGSAWLRAFGGNDGANSSDESQPKQADGKRGSSPVLPPPAQPRVSAWTETTYDNSDDEGTNWSSINTPEVAIGVPVVRRIGLPASIRMPKRQDTRESQLSHATDSRSRETLPIMLNASSAQQADAQGSPASEAEAPVATPQLPTWHHRVGDQCPTFSVRKTETKARKMPPPAPLPLHTISTRKIIAIHQAEPSPLESPAEAIRQIRAQLRKLDDLPQTTPESASRRMELLKDLEREMGQQAEHWEEIKHDMGRDSMSTMQSLSPTVRDSRHTSVASALDVARASAQRSTDLEHWASQEAQMQRDNNLEALKIPEASVRDSPSPKLSKWQKRLTEAQMDYMDAKLLTASNAAFTQLSKAQLASPTPPDSDDSELPPLPILDEGIPAQQPAEEPTKHVSLWKPAPKVAAAPTGLLWTAPSRPAPEPEAPLPGLSLRPAQRKELPPLQIESRQLWRKPYDTANRTTSGLWRPLWASAAPPAEPLARVSSKSGSASRKPPRPVTQRPPRRNKRVTLLPDILESPEPLPDKRGTLGIFQFPWGEKSDTASIQPRQSMYMAMPGTMTSGGPSGAMAGRTGQWAPTDYSSSFFDEYDNDDDRDVVDMDSYEEDSDDEFDDSTLWEIASLLRTDSVPSRDSLFPPSFEPVVDSDPDELSSDEEEESIFIGLDASLEVLSEQQRDSATLESSTLLVLKDALESKTPPRPAVSVGLPALPKASLDSREVPVTSDSTPTPELSTMARHTTEVQEIKTANEQCSTGLWIPPSPASSPPARDGLFVLGRNPSDYRSTSEEPAALVIRRAPRPVDQRPLERLASTKLWAAEDAVNKRERNWILGEQPMLKARKAWRPHFTREDWQAALREAIQASRPVTRKPRRIAATKAEWEAALQEAVFLSTTRLPFDSSTRHPVFAAASLTARTELFHPAATGYTYDIAAVHPVFFGSLAITCPQEAVHPAMSAHAEKILLLQQCSETHQSSGSQGYSASHGQTETEEDIRSSDQHQHLQEEKDEGVNEVQTSSYAPSPIPTALESASSYEHDMIQARTEALEQERLFVERAVHKEYRRRTSMAPPAAIVEQQPSMTAEGLAGVEMVQELQRRLSLRIRQSLVFVHPAPVPVSEEPKETPTAESKEVRAVSPGLREPVRDRQGEQLLLWKPRVPAAMGLSTGLWSANSEHNQPVTAPSVEEDAYAASQRAQRRRTLQKKQRTQEVLAQMPLVDFTGMGLWVSWTQALTTRTMDWLHSACVSGPNGAASTSAQKLWTTPARSVASSAPNGLWTAPRTTDRPSPGLFLSEDVSAAPQWTIRYHRRRQETSAYVDEVQHGAELWSQKSSSVVSRGLRTKHDWLHSTCVPKATVPEARREKERLWTAPLRSHVTASQTGLWETSTAGGRSPVSSLPEDNNTLACSHGAWSGSPRRQLDMSTQPIEIDLGAAELWTRKNSPASLGSMDRRDWLHTACLSVSVSASASAPAAPAPASTPSPAPTSGYPSKQLLWTRPSSSSSSTTTRSGLSTGLWTAPTTTSARPSVSSSSAAAAMVVDEEDGVAAAARARRRKAMQELQELQEMQEVLARIAAVERGVDPSVHFPGMKMWTAPRAAVAADAAAAADEVGSGKAGGRDWLHSLCVRPTEGGRVEVFG